MRSKVLFGVILSISVAFCLCPLPTEFQIYAKKLYEDHLNEYKDQAVALWIGILRTLNNFPEVKMRTAILTAFAFCATVFAQSNVESYIAKEKPIAKAGILANIGPSGSRAAGASPGVIIASPSKQNPPYFFTWTRDASLVIKGLIDEFTRGDDSSLRTTIDNYISSQIIQQKVSNPSGSITTGGLGEPKFNVDLTAYTGEWGRPQRDGPALRATAIITYANWLLSQSNNTFVTNTLWPIIKTDLDYTAATWNLTGFDLWEEVSSSSYFTSASQHRALREGAALAARIGQTSVVSAYTKEADNVLCFLQSYWNPSQGFMTSNTGGGRSGKDANTALASVHNFDPEAGCDSVTFQPCSDKALSSLKVYVDAFRSGIYPINNGIASNAAVATGRYTEDVYYNGNPWYLTTTVVAEQLYDALIVWNKQGSLEVTPISLPFFRQFSPSVAVGTYSKSSSTFSTLITAVKDFADGFIDVVAKYTPADGSLAEQFIRNTGAPTSATHLTWSYSAILAAFHARDGITPASWGAKGLSPTASCGSGGAGSVQVTFNVRATTFYGENIYITGSVDALKNWNPDHAVLLSAANYPTWSVTLPIPANTAIQFKFIRKANGQVTWQSDPNNAYTIPASGTYVINENWR
ncbi:Glucoamylase [Psilocybe cubensis]|uniref:Glucoamylase n=2 Tax=Psilocybe cubensis TaxID=181762 RepID=A0ACB8GYZ0_PSICU|nr:Glucoamylase [Psilocybe cubensis]KAH9480597.1 Glucoamylase [Psilocybe cubensis]